MNHSIQKIVLLFTLISSFAFADSNLKEAKEKESSQKEKQEERREQEKHEKETKTLPPIAIFLATQQTFSSPYQYKFDASLSYSPSNIKIIKYFWQFGDYPERNCEDRELEESRQTKVEFHSYKKPGTYTVTLTILDQKGKRASVSQKIKISTSQAPIVKLAVKPSTTGVAPYMALFDASLTTTNTNAALSYQFNFGDGQSLTSAKPIVSHLYQNAGTYSASLKVTDVNGLNSTITVTMNITAPQLPVDPVTTAPTLSKSAPQSLDSQLQFLYQGANAVQTNVATGAIDAKRSSLVHGVVKDQSNNALSGVKITVLEHPDLGQTLSRADGQFDIVVNSGDAVTLKYEKGGYTDSQRKIRAFKTDYYNAPDVMLTTLDSKVTLVQMSSSTVQSHTATTVTDSDGSRTAKILFKPGTTANLVLPGGGTVSVPQVSVRVTEYTVGANGPKMMPGDLPTNSAYTYAVELSSDEALALGASSVQFSKPYSYYVDNFINAPVGGAVPLGIYNKAKGYWEADKDGIVIKILGKDANGLAQVDLDGTNQPANAQKLTAWGFDNDELTYLAGTYSSGKSLWRVRVSHFSSEDLNFAAVDKGEHFENSVTKKPKCTNSCECSTHGCVIDTSRRVWQESIPLKGINQEIHYSSDRSYGWGGSSTFKVNLYEGQIPASLQSIQVDAKVAGVTKTTIVPPNGNMNYEFIWDGKDVFGRDVTQPTNATITITYNFQSQYYVFPAIPDGSTFNSPWSANTVGIAFPSRQAFSLEQNVNALLNPPKLYQSSLVQSEVGGWTFSQHHQYNSVNKNLTLGNGHAIDANAISPVITNLVGGGTTLGDGGLALNSQLQFPVYYRPGPDGAAYITDYGHSRIRRVDQNGVITTVVGTGVSGYSGDGGLATSAKIGAPVGLSFDTDGNMYFADATMHVIRKVDTAGYISTIAGTGVAGYTGDGGLATAAQINQPYAVFPINDGSILFADTGNHVIRQILPSGIVRTYAGNGTQGYSGDGGPALSASFNNPNVTYADQNGTLYVVDIGNSVIRKIAAGGIVSTVVGTGVAGYSGDGGPAINAQINQPRNVVVTERGELYFADSLNHVIRYVDQSGKIKTVAGVPLNAGYNGSDIAADKTYLNFPTGLYLYPDDTLVIADSGNNLIRKMTAPGPLNIQGFYVFASSDASEMYVFDLQGKHIRTITGNTGTVKWEFGYDVNNLLTSMIDANQNVTTIVRDTNGLVSKIVGPYGQTYLVSLDANGYLQQLTEPTGEAYQITNSNTGLVTKFTFPKGNFSQVSYNTDGTLLQDINAAGGTKTFAIDSILNKVTMTTSMGRQMSVTQQEVPWRAYASSTTLTYEDGSQSNSVLDGGQSSKTTSAGVALSHNGFDPRLKSLTQFTDGELFTTADSQKQTFSTTVRSLTFRSNFDFDMRETYVKDNAAVVIKDFSTTNLITTTTTGAGRITKTQIDTQERPILAQVGNFAPMSVSYDARGRISQTSQGARTTTYTYNNLGYLNQITDPMNRVTTFTTDASGRVLQSTLPGNRQIASSYDANSNLTALTTPTNQTHQMNFNTLDFMSDYIAPAIAGVNSVTSYLFNLDRQPSTISRPDTQIVKYIYDEPYNRIKQIGTASEYVTFNYDTQARQIASFSSDNIQISYSYDGTLPLAKTYQLGGNQVATAVSYTNPGLLVATRSVAGSTVNLGYDQDQALQSIGPMTIQRDTTSGLVVGTQLGNISEINNYSQYAELSDKKYQVSNSTIFQESMLRDNLGRITQNTVNVQGTTFVYGYTYDLAGRLTDVTVNGSTYSHYDFDQNGNRTNATINGTSYAATYDVQDRIKTYGNNAYTFTANGDLATKTNSSGVNSYNFDVFGHTRSVSLPNGQVISYKTDGEGKRIARLLNGVSDRYYVYNESGQLVGELNSSGILIAHYIYATQVHSPDYMIKNGVNYKMIKDHLGSIRAVVDASNGSVAQQIDYDEFGVVINDTNLGFQVFGYAGGIYDVDTKLVRFGARDYDAEIGRWLSKDPIGFKGRDTNLFGYAVGDPINKIDSNGESWIGATAAVLCAAYDVYSTYQTFIDINKYQSEMADINKQIASLDSERDCDKIADLQKKAIDLSAKLAKAQASGPAKGLATMLMCAGLSKL